MQARSYVVGFSLVLLTLGSSGRAQEAAEGLAAEVEAVERAFARTMADRDFEAFQEFLADEAIFLGGGTVRRGKAAVVEQWSNYFEAAEAPFSWQPETVAVLDSGRLAISTGPVYNAAGERISTFTSTWRRTESGEWRIVFDKGDRWCE